MEEEMESIMDGGLSRWSLVSDISSSRLKTQRMGMSSTLLGFKTSKIGEESELGVCPTWQR